MLMYWRAALWLAAVLALVAACLLRFAGQLPIQTDLLALLPATERNPVAEMAVKRLGDVAGNRAVFLVGDVDATRTAAAARRFAAALRASAAFRQVQDDIPALDLRRLAQPYLEHRFNFLAAADRQALRGPAALEERLQRRLYAPFRFAAVGDPALDPFGFLDAFFGELPFRNMRLDWQDGLLFARTPPGAPAYALVIAELDGSAYDGKVQDRVLAAVASAERAMAEAAPQAKLLRSGAVFFAGDARLTAQRDVDLIGCGSLIGIVLLLFGVFRSLKPLALGLFSVAVGLAVAASVVSLVCGEMHLLTLVFGASLIGEAVDYSIQYFAVYVAAGEDWEPWRGLRKVRPSLSLALGTSVLGYATLLLLPFPAIGQIALFALTGLIAALLSVFLVLPLFLRRPYRHDIEALTQAPERFLAFWRRRVGPRQALILAGAVVLLSAPGWLLLRGEDDIRLLIDRPAGLAAQEAQIRELTGFDSSSQFYLVEGETEEQLLQREEALRSALDKAVAQGGLSHYQALSAFVPSAERQAENRALLERAGAADPHGLSPLFARYAFHDDAARRQSDDFAKAGTLSLEEWLATPLAAPVRHLWLGKTAHGYAAIVLPFGVRAQAALASASADLPGVSLVDKAGNVSRLFGQYRAWGSLGIVCVALAVLALLIWRYGLIRGLASLLPTLLGMGVALAVCAYCGQTISLFNVMGLMLVLGVGVNYAIFLQTGSGRDGITLTAVLLSAATTLLSFGLLAFSGTPALARFGLTLLAGIAAAVLLAPLALCFGRAQENETC